VDDHPLVRRALCQVIEAEADMVVCGEAEDRGDALLLIKASSPHLAIVDLSLKSSDGVGLGKGHSAATS
jgi:DNA-binding NarL/FixJ family response regulator